MFLFEFLLAEFYHGVLRNASEVESLIACMSCQLWSHRTCELMHGVRAMTAVRVVLEL